MEINTGSDKSLHKIGLHMLVPSKPHLSSCLGNICIVIIIIPGKRKALWLQGFEHHLLVWECEEIQAPCSHDHDHFRWLLLHSQVRNSCENQGVTVSAGQGSLCLAPHKVDFETMMEVKEKGRPTLILKSSQWLGSYETPTPQTARDKQFFRYPAWYIYVLISGWQHNKHLSGRGCEQKQKQRQSELIVSHRAFDSFLLLAFMNWRKKSFILSFCSIT